MDNSGHQETNQYSSGREEGRSPFTSPDSGLTNTSTDSSLSQRLGTPPNMYESVGQMCLPESGIRPMYDQQHQQQTNIGSIMSVMDNNCQPMPPDSQTGRNVILNQAESTHPAEVSSPVSMPSNIGVRSDNYSSMSAPAVTRVTGVYNGTEAHEIAAAVSTALAPDSNNLERVSQSPYQHTGQVMQGIPDKGTHVISTNTSRKPAARSSKKKKKKDPHEPQKPVSAYALFFRDTQASIKVQKPNASFGEVSKIVASMWDGLNQDTKNKYKKQTEAAKKEYLKLLADYKASLVSRGKNSRESHFNPGDDYGHYHVEEANRRNNSPRPNPGMNDSMYNMQQQHRLPSPMAKGKSPLFSPILTPEGPGGVGMQGQRNDVTGSSLPPHSPLQQYGGGMHQHGNGDQQRHMNDPMRCSYSNQMNDMSGQSQQQHHYIHENPAVSLNTSSGMYAPPMSVQAMSGSRQSHMMYSTSQHCQPQMMMTSMHNQEQQGHHYPQSPYNEYTNLHSSNDMMGQQMQSMNTQNGSNLMMNGNDGTQSDVTYMQMSVGHQQQGGMGSNDIMLGRMPSPRVSDNRGYNPNGSPLSSYQQSYNQMSYEGATNGGNVDSYRMTSYSVDTDNGLLEVGKEQMHAIPVSQAQMQKPMNWGMADQGRTIADLDSRKVNHERDIDRYSFTHTAYSSPGTDSSASLTCTKSEEEKVEPTSSISRFFEGFSPSLVCNQSNTWIGDHISTPNS